MKVDIYYDDYPLEGAYDYPKKTFFIKNEKEFWSEINNRRTKFIRLIDNDKKSYGYGKKCYLNKDRIIEICIDENEEKEWKNLTKK